MVCYLSTAFERAGTVHPCERVARAYKSVQLPAGIPNAGPLGFLICGVSWLEISHFVCVCQSVMSRLFATPRTAAHQAPLSVEFSRQEYWSGLPFPSPGDLPSSGFKPRSPALQAILYCLSHLFRRKPDGWIERRGPWWHLTPPDIRWSCKSGPCHVLS